MRVDCYWKLFLDVFKEYYHLASVHRTTINDVYITPEPGDMVSGAYASQFGSTQGTGNQLQGVNLAALPMMPGLIDPEASGVRYTWLFPNMAFAACVDALWIYEAYPIGPDRCLVFQTTCFPPQALSNPAHGAAISSLFQSAPARP